MDNASNQEKLQALQFSVQQNNCCLELKHVEKVVLLPALQMIPGSPNFVAGLMNVHGISVIVIDLALRLGLNRTHHYSLDMPVLLCREGENLFGMIVDHITGLKEISLENITLRDQLQGESFILASVKIANELTLLINLKSIFKFELVNHPPLKESSV